MIQSLLKKKFSKIKISENKKQIIYDIARARIEEIAILYFSIILIQKVFLRKFKIF